MIIIHPQILQSFRAPVYFFLAASIASAYALILLYFDQFLFFSPYLVLYVPISQWYLFGLDLALSVLASIVFAASIRQAKIASMKPNMAVRTGVFGFVAAIIAGACPCYYLVPLLAVAGGVGGVLGAIGILFNEYQVPVKIGSVFLLLLLGLTLERSLTASCPVKQTVNNPEDRIR